MNRQIVASVVIGVLLGAVAIAAFVWIAGILV